MTDVVTYHNSGRGIIIAPTARLTFNHCHFASKCSWRGILIDHTLSSFGELILNGGTLVEGTGTLGFGGVTVAAGTVAAPNAYVPSGYVVSSGGHSILQSTDAIFNSNLTGILLSYWPASSSAPAIMPFRVYNTVFTEANFTPFYSGAASTIDDHYPMSWPTVSSLKTIASLPGSADYNFNPYYGIDDYTASTSVVNNRVGITLSGGFTDPTTGVYKSFVTGDKTTASNFNLFSNLRTGIYVGTGSGTLNSGANAIVYNSVFKLKYNGTINPIGPSFPDAGIKVMNKIQGYNFLLGVGDDGSSTETGTSLGNKFYNMSIGVRALVDGNSPYGYHTIVVRNSLMTSKNTTASFVDNLAVTAHSQIFDKIDIKDNIIQNVSKGVEVFLKALSGTYNWGAVNVDNNNLGVSNTGYVSGTSGFMNNAITAADVPGAGVTGYTDIGSVKINSNVIRDVYNGISVSDFVRKPIQISHNEITLKATPSQTIQRGIFVDECASSLSGGSRDNNEVADNKVTGPGWQVPAGEGTYFAINNVFSGIYFLKSGSSGHLFDVSCNYTYELRQGFHFVWNNYISWKRNVMENTKVGLLLAGNASFPYPPTIGDQGAACDPSDNLWIEHPGVFDWSTTTGCYQTYLNSVNPATSTPTSKLYVRNSPGYLPTVNGSQSIWGTSTLKYTFGTSLIDASTGCSLSDATRCDPAGGGPKAGGSSVITAAAKISYTLSPNPSQGSFSISQSEAVDGIVKVKVFNAVGTEVYGNNLQFTSGSAQVNINDVVSGIYLVEVIDGAGARSVYRIMIQK